MCMAYVILQKPAKRHLLVVTEGIYYNLKLERNISIFGMINKNLTQNFSYYISRKMNIKFKYYIMHNRLQFEMVFLIPIISKTLFLN